MKLRTSFVRCAFVFALLVIALSAFSEDAIKNLGTVALEQSKPKSPKPSEETDKSFERSVFDMSLEELIRRPVASSATLTKTPRRIVPAAVTTITQEMIRSSGARNLNEVFDIFVPNVEIMRHHVGNDRLGIRGSINFPENKYLILVNGRVMNLRTYAGAFTERDLPMLGDIHRVDFVRGSGSVIYGPGAVSGVVSIVTYNGLNFNGAEIIARQGFVEQFSSLEFRMGHQFDDESGIFFHYGLTDYDGADQSDSPHIFSRSFTTNTGVDVEAGRPVDFNIVNDREAFRAHPKHKLHIQYTRGNFDAWVRYTRGGEQTTEVMTFLAPPPLGIGTIGEQARHGVGTGYQQFTMLASYDRDLSDTFNVELRIRYDFAAFEQTYKAASRLDHLFNRSSQESELYGRVLARWTPNESHSLAFGLEYSHGWFGHDASGFATTPTRTWSQPEVSRWSTDSYSPLAEYQ